jgi:hypothetical protein
MRRGAGYGYANRVVSRSDSEIDSLKGEIQSLRDSLGRMEAQIEKLAGK